MSKKTFISLIVSGVLLIGLAIFFVSYGLYKMFTGSAEPYTYIMCGVWVLLFIINVLSLVMNIKAYVNEVRHEKLISKIDDELKKVHNSLLGEENKSE